MMSSILRAWEAIRNVRRAPVSRVGQRSVLLPVALCISACIGGGKGLSSEEKARLGAYILAASPASAKPLDVDFDGKVHLVGYHLEPEAAAPGTEVKVTMYWRCDEPPGEGWNLFTHVANSANGQISNLDWNGPIREQHGDNQILGPSRWERGKVYVDAQTFTVPEGDNANAGQSPEWVVRAGVWKGDNRLKILSGTQDGTNAAIVAHLVSAKDHASNVAPHRDPQAVPELTAMRLAAGQSITVDGKADESAWVQAATTGLFVDVATGKPAPSSAVGGSAKLLWNDTHLYIFFDVRDRDLKGGYTDQKANPSRFTTVGQPKLWERDTVEIMTDPDGDGDNIDYYELQINPENKIFHSRFDTYNGPRGGENGPFGHEDWDPKLQSAVVVRGTIDKPGDDDDGYSVELAIPWRAFAKAMHAPPMLGDSWRMNFYAMQDNGGVSWSPILGQGNFHKATRFGRVRWGMPVPAVQSLAGEDAGIRGDASQAGAPKATLSSAPSSATIHRGSASAGPQLGSTAVGNSAKSSSTTSTTSTALPAATQPVRRGVVKLPN